MYRVFFIFTRRNGTKLLAFPIVLGFISTRMPRLVQRYGFKRFMVMGRYLLHRLALVQPVHLEAATGLVYLPGAVS